MVQSTIGNIFYVLWQKCLHLDILEIVIGDTVVAPISCKR